MKFKKKIWNVVRHFTVIVLFFLYVNSIKAQCPKAIICDPSRGLGLQYDGPISNLNALNTYLNFGQGDVRNGYYLGGDYPTDPDPVVRNTIYYEVSCNTGINNLIIRFNDNNHTYCDMRSTSQTTCQDYIKSFDFDFLDALFDIYSPNYSCQTWIGDCGSNGTIYRGGPVSIGTTYKHKNYLLAVSGKMRHW